MKADLVGAGWKPVAGGGRFEKDGFVLVVQESTVDRSRVFWSLLDGKRVVGSGYAVTESLCNVVGKFV